MSGLLHPALWALLSGIAIALRGLFGIGPWWVEPIVWGVALVTFAVWCGLWVRHRTFAPAVWLGVLIAIWTPLTQGVFFDTYAANNPDFAEGASGAWMFFTGAAITVVYAVSLGLLASAVAWAARRREPVAVAA